MTPLRALALVGLLLALDATGGHAQAYAAETHIVQLQHRDAEDVLPILLPLLEPGGRITGRQYQLFVRTSDRNFAEIEHVLSEIDTPLRNLRITVRHNDSRNTLSREQQVSAGQRLGGNTRIVIPPSSPGHGGLVVRREGVGGNVQYSSEQRADHRSQNASQFVSVVEGRRAYIAVGLALPQVQSFLLLAGGRLTLTTGVSYRSVSTGFEVLPRIHGDEADLEITPRLAFLSDQGSQQVTFSELSTHVRVRTGEWVDLGGVISNNSEVGRRILGTGTYQSQEQSRFEVRVDD